MISSKNIAFEVSAASEQFITAMNDALNTAKGSCTTEELEKFKRALGAVIGTLEIDLLWPIYKQHPELEPESMKDWKNET